MEMLMLIKIDYETHYPHTHSNLFVSMMYFLPFISVVIIFNIISHNYFFLSSSVQIL